MPTRAAQILIQALREQTHQFSDDDLTLLRDLFTEEYQRRLHLKEYQLGVDPDLEEEGETDEDKQEDLTHTLEHTFGHLSADSLSLIKQKIQRALP